MTGQAQGNNASGTPEFANVYQEGQSSVGHNTLPPPSLIPSNTVSLQKLGTPSRTQGPLIYTSAARCANNLTPKDGALGPDKAHIVLAKWSGEVEGNGGKQCVQGCDFAERNCSSHGVQRDPWPGWLLEEMHMGMLCQAKRKNLKGAFKNKSRSNHLRWRKILLP